MEEKKLLFHGQDENETVIKILSRHQFVIVKSMLPALVLAVISLGVSLYFFDIWYVVLGGFIVLLFAFTWCFYEYFIWSRDTYIITDQRIIDIEQATFFHRSQKEAPLEKIQNVETEINGFWPSILHYGTVIIQTASDTALTLSDISHPETIQKTIVDLVQEKTNDVKKNEGLIQKIVDLLRSASKEEIVEAQKHLGANDSPLRANDAVTNSATETDQGDDTILV